MSWPILIVDNASASVFTESLLSLPNEYPNLKFQFVFQKNRSLSAARQSALDYCKTDWITFLDPSCCVTARWAEYSSKWMKVLKHDPNVWAWGGPSIQKSKDPIQSIAQGFQQLYPQLKTSVTYRTVKLIPNSQLFLKTKNIRDLGGFPKGYDRIGGDMALSLLIRSLGGKLFEVERPRVFHIQKSSLFSSLKGVYEYGEAAGKIARRHPVQFLSKDFLPLYAIGAGGASLLVVPLQLMAIWGASALGFTLLLAISSTASFRRSFTSLVFGISAALILSAASLKGLLSRGLRKQDF